MSCSRPNRHSIASQVLAVAAAWAAAGAVGLLAPGARAEPAVDGGQDPIVVTATVLPAELSRMPASVSVLHGDWLRAQNAAGAADLLRQLAGVHVDQAGSRGGVGSVYLRGLDPNYTLVLLDGVRVNDPLNSRGGAFDFSTLGAADLERIEIVRGPLSAVYGSEAMAGVVNVITRQGGGADFREVGVSAGRFDEYAAGLHAGGTAGPLGYALGANWAQQGEAIEGNDYRGDSLHANLAWTISDKTVGRATLRRDTAHRESFPDDSGGPDYAVLRAVDERDSEDMLLGLSFEHAPAAGWDVVARFSVFDHHEDFDSPGVAPGPRDPFGIPANGARNAYRPYDASLRTLYAWGDHARLAGGVEARWEEGTSRGSLDMGGSAMPTDFALSRRTWAPFAEVQVEPLDGLQLQAGLRVDVPDELAAESSPRIAAAYTIGKTDTTLRAGWGEGFKLPSFFALSHPLVGNPDLVAERSQGFDAGLDQRFVDRRVGLHLTCFQSRVNDAIDLEEGPPPRLVNRAEVTAEGIEMGADLELHRTLRNTLCVTWVQTDIAGTDEELRNRPEWRASLATRWRPTDALDVVLRNTYVGETLDSSVPTGDVTLDAYLRTDLAANWTVAGSVRLFAAVDNLFDSRYEEYVGFAAPGISPRAGVSVTF